MVKGGDQVSTNGMSDIRVGLKYNVLPTLRSMVVFGFGVCTDRCHEGP